MSRAAEKDAELYLRRSAKLEGQVAVLNDHVTRLRARLLDMLRAPYERMGAWATPAACQEVDHPPVRHDGGCACGKVPGTRA